MTTTGSRCSASRATSSAARSPAPTEEIRAFVNENYNIDFPMFAKIEVNGDGACDLYHWLRSRAAR